MAFPSKQDPVSPTASHSIIRKLAQPSYPHPSEGRQRQNHNHRKLTKLITVLCILMKLWAMRWRKPPKTDGSWWRVLTKHGPLVKGMASHFIILGLSVPWTVWKDEPPRSAGVQYAAGEERRNSSRRNEEDEPKQKQCPAVNMSHGELNSDSVKNNIA